mmetsp:Transcript_64090/g.133639  ORF Transcript_64090/g.133639 Transcript_64090/m.133639 type:complete len:222 (+) Transcript_64090:1610-2275(+)
MSCRTCCEQGSMRMRWIRRRTQRCITLLRMDGWNACSCCCHMQNQTSGTAGPPPHCRWRSRKVAMRARRFCCSFPIRSMSTFVTTTDGLSSALLSEAILRCLSLTPRRRCRGRFHRCCSVPTWMFRRLTCASDRFSTTWQNPKAPSTRILSFSSSYTVGLICCSSMRRVGLRLGLLSERVTSSLQACSSLTHRMPTCHLLATVRHFCICCSKGLGLGRTRG